MTFTCCVSSCKTKKTSGIGFFRIPAETDVKGRQSAEKIERRRRWIEVIRRNNLVYKYARVCSKHFLTGHPVDDRSHPDWVPSLNLGYSVDKPKPAEEPTVELPQPETEAESSRISKHVEGNKQGKRAEIYFLSNFCSLCLVHSKHVTTQSTICSSAQDAIQCLLPDYASQDPEIPKQICIKCLITVDNISKFRQKCIESIAAFKDYVEKLSKECRSQKYPLVPVTGTSQKNIENTKKEKNYEIKTEIIETDDSESETENEDNTMEEVFIKCEDNTDYQTEELNEELMIKDESGLSGNEAQSILGKNIIGQHGQSSDMDDDSNLVESEDQLMRFEDENEDLTVVESQGQCIQLDDGEDVIIVESQERQSTEHVSTSADPLLVSSNTVKTDATIKPKDPRINESPFACDICHQKFKYPNRLKIHKRLAHTKGKAFVCKLCRKSFSFQSLLKLHLRTHSAEKPFICDICGKAFNKSNNLDIHKRVHLGQKPYQCEYCDKAFSFSSHLTSHRRIHTGERPYQCEVCDKSFARSDYLKKHQLSHKVETAD